MTTMACKLPLLVPILILLWHICAFYLAQKSISRLSAVCTIVFHTAFLTVMCMPGFKQSSHLEREVKSHPCCVQIHPAQNVVGLVTSADCSSIVESVASMSRHLRAEQVVGDPPPIFQHVIDAYYVYQEAEVECRL